MAVLATDHEQRQGLTIAAPPSLVSEPTTAEPPTASEKEENEKCNEKELWKEK